MSGGNIIQASFVDARVQLRWELDKKQFDDCEFPNKLASKTFNAQLATGEKSKWVINLYPKGKTRKDSARVSLQLVSQDKTYKLRFAIGVKTNVGYWPRDFLRKLDNKHTFMGKVGENVGSGHRLCSTEELSSKFVQNKFTIEAHLVINMEERERPSPVEIANDVSTIPALGNLSNFTIICHDKQFPCHKVLLAARSRYFEALFRTEPRKTEMKMDDFSSDIVEALINFISQGSLPSDLNETALDLIKLADMYGVNLLAKACEVFLIKNLSIENALETLVIVDKHVRKNDTRETILDFIKRESLQIVNPLGEVCQKLS